MGHEYLLEYLTDHRGLSRTVPVLLELLIATLSILALAIAPYLVQGAGLPSLMVTALESASGLVQVVILPLMIQHDQSHHVDVGTATERMTMVYNAGYYGG